MTPGDHLIRFTDAPRGPRHFDARRAFPIDLTALADIANLIDAPRPDALQRATLWNTASGLWALTLRWTCGPQRLDVYQLAPNTLARLCWLEGVAPYYLARAARAWHRDRRATYPGHNHAQDVDPGAP